MRLEANIIVSISTWGIGVLAEKTSAPRGGFEVWKRVVQNKKIFMKKTPRKEKA